MVRSRFPAHLASAFALLIAASGCGDQPAAPRPVAGTVTLAPGQYAMFSGALAAGPLLFPATDSVGLGAEYLVVAQFATARADLASSFALAGTQPLTAPAAPTPPPRGAVPAALRFHDALRRMDEAVARLPAPPAEGAGPRGGPPAIGSKRAFTVCANLDCSATARVTAVAQVVGRHNAIYLDTLASPDGFTANDLQQLSAQFDTVLYPLDTLAFGAPSDIDGNGVVIILLTPRVNALVPKPDCGTSFVTGYFLAADLAPATRAAFNNGEVFYAMVPDPTGSVSCAQSTIRVKTLVPPTFIHEFQHMISFNQHVLQRRGPIEVLWLNEGMSHLAEELGARHYDSLADHATAKYFIYGDLYNANLYLQNPSAVAMVTATGMDELGQRGAEWLFVRYLADRFGPATIQRLEQTAQTGAANVVTAAGGTSFADLLGCWALALYVSDLSSFSAEPELRYASWSFRATFDSLHTVDGTTFSRAFPLQPVYAPGPSFAVNGVVSSGSGTYLQIGMPAGTRAFTLTFTSPTGLALTGSANPQLAIVRLR